MCFSFKIIVTIVRAIRAICLMQLCKSNLLMLFFSCHFVAAFGESSHNESQFSERIIYTIDT